MTKGQLARKYDSMELAEEICQRKLNDPELREKETKPHMDNPDNEADAADVAVSACHTLHGNAHNS